MWVYRPNVCYKSDNQANSALYPFGVGQLSSKLIQTCGVLLGRRHLVNAYEMDAGWLIPFVWVAGKTV